MPELSRRVKKRILTAVAFGVALALCGFVIAAALTPKAPPGPTIDVAAVKAKWAKEEAEAKAKEAAAIEAGKVQLTRPVGRPLKVLMAGDSLAAGWHASLEKNSFRVKTIEALRTKGPVDFVPAYFAGAKTKDLLDQNRVAEGLDLAIIQVGTNDYSKLTALPAFRTQYGGYLDALRVASPNVQFLCTGAWSAAQGKVQEYDVVMQQECVKRGGKFMDLRSIAFIQANRSVAGILGWAGATDSGHPNDAGHAKITEVILARLSKLMV